MAVLLTDVTPDWTCLPGTNTNLFDLFAAYAAKLKSLAPASLSGTFHASLLRWASKLTSTRLVIKTLHTNTDSCESKQ
jgi:hypothetical protein